jgi:hypothetical protein
MHWGLALAACLLLASGPFDIAISSVIWNPPVADALIKMTAASALTLEDASPLWRIGVTAMLAWMAVQTHLSAAFPAAAIMAGVALTRIRKWRPLAVIAAVILALQVPFLISMITQPDTPAGPTRALAGITSGTSFRPMFGLDVVAGVTGNLFLPMPDQFKFWIPAVICGAIVMAVYRRDPIAIGASIGGILLASLVFATWTASYDGYWFLAMTPGLVLTFTLTIAAIPWRPAVAAIGIAAAAWCAVQQPNRIARSRVYFEYPQYETMVRGSRELVARAPVVRDVRVSFDVHPTMDRQSVYKILGGRIDATARYVATINGDGSVRLDQ